MSKAIVKKQLIKKPTNIKPITSVSLENGFHFCTNVGNYTGISATNLSEFDSKLKIIPAESIKFHFQRKDFEKWIRDTFKDAALAERIGSIKEEQSTEDLRKEILKTLETSICQSL
jgi:tRNA(His) 5'-end guanylyltransferase